MPDMYRTPATKYNMNSVADINSHAASLFNERINTLLYWLDFKSVNMNAFANVQSVMEVRAITKQVYKNIRCLISNNPTMRATMNLDTKENGIYIPDVIMGLVDDMIEHCNTNGFTTKKLNIIIYELNNLEVLIKNIMQYYHYFLRPNYSQKPDVQVAVEQYKQFADERTVEELRGIVGKGHHIDFENLGIDKIELNKIDYEEQEPSNLLRHKKDAEDKDYYIGDENDGVI